MKVQKNFGPVWAAALAVTVLVAAGCSSNAQGTARSAPTPATPSATASPTVSPTAKSAAPTPASPAPAPATASADPSVPPVQRNPQPLSPGQTREDLINAGVSPEDAAAWPTLPTVTAEDARRIVADSLQNSPDLVYDVFENPDGTFDVKVRAKSIMAQGGSGTVGLYVVSQSGAYSLK